MCTLVAQNRIDAIGEGIYLPLLLGIALILRICYPSWDRLKTKSHVSQEMGDPRSTPSKEESAWASFFSHPNF